MSNLLLDKMWARAQNAKEDSDVSYFYDLTLVGEVITKLVVLSIAASIKDDKARQRYSVLYQLVRADGIGFWSESLSGMLKGPAAQLFLDDSKIELRELTQKVSVGSWQYDAIESLFRCRNVIDKDLDRLPTKLDLVNWFAQFSSLRNRTRGHGAITGKNASKAARYLEASLRMLIDSFSLFNRQWAYLHQNLSGKYRISPISSNTNEFEYLKQKRQENYCDGVYIYFGKPVFIELVFSNPDVNNFYLPNGKFTSRKFQVLSYLNDEIHEEDASHYLSPATDLPPSETQGYGLLDVRGESFSNIPPTPDGYIKRPELETELHGVLMHQRHDIVTIAGRGGIGKTWLSLFTLNKLCSEKRYACIIWFSARDIDLLTDGAKIVKAHVFNQKDIANEYVNLLQPAEASSKTFNGLSYFQNALSSSSIGPSLFVFDNFETVSNPHEIFEWLSTYIRHPNKILITTRVRDFKGDYPIEVQGMSQSEFDLLIEATASSYGITQHIDTMYKQQLFDESSGHPYVAKILLGELAKNPHTRNVRRVVATRMDILDALFERTYNSLSLVARRIFLTLCSWRSIIPQLALEAILLRPEHTERMDVEKAVEELRRSSFVEVKSDDSYDFLSVPLVAYQFGQGKLSVSPDKLSIQADIDLLQMFGAAQNSDVARGIEPRIHRLFKMVAERASQDRSKLDGYIPILEFTARRYIPGWFLLASLYDEFSPENNKHKSKACIRKYIEYCSSDAEKYEGWKRLADICQETQDYSSEAQARIELCKIPITPFSVISAVANRINQLFRDRSIFLETDEKRILVKSLVQVMQSRSAEASANDLSRLSWLYMHLGDEDNARKYAELGIEKDHYNSHCLSLLDKLGSKH